MKPNKIHRNIYILSSYLGRKREGEFLPRKTSGFVKLLLSFNYALTGEKPRKGEIRNK